ncbi:MAG: AraC family transcriptional regulator [Gammaproteobacteria bacterium]|nr:AraC family transcriptional regulator [Gammaproteobacteria bacterium]
MLLQSLEGARNAGFDINRLLNKCDIDPELLEQTDIRIPLEKFVLLSRYTSGNMNDELVGLLNKPVRLGYFHTLALNAVHAPTIEQAFQRIITFHNLFENSLYFELKTQGKQSEFIISRYADQTVLNNFGIEFMLATQHRFIGWLANQRIILNQVKLDYPEPFYNSEYHYIFYGTPVLFNQNTISISFDSSYLKLKTVKTEAEVESYIRRAPMDLYLPVHAGGKMTARIRNRINVIFTNTEKAPELDNIASELQLHPQTLRRQLKREGTSFHTITAQVRRDIAIHHLGAAELSVERIAIKTGYTEPSAFIRAFKAWTGFTPLTFRKGLSTST